MSSEAPRYPVDDLAIMRRLAKPLGYSGLKAWFDTIDPSLKLSPSRAIIPKTDNLPEQDVRHIGGYFRSLVSLGFTNTETPGERVTIRGRQHKVGQTIHDVEDLDLLGTEQLMWKKGVGNSLNLVPRGFKLNCSYEPSIVTVESAKALTPITAERLLQRTALLMFTDHIPTKK